MSGFARVFAHRALRAAALAACLGGGALPALHAQEEPAEEGPRDALRVFFDCQRRFCDFDFYRREVPFVNYTRDREVSQVHLLMTSEETGSGGNRITLDFIGREAFAGLDDRLEVTTRANLAQEQVLTQVAASMRLGLLRYVARTGQAADIQVLYAITGEREAGSVATAENDPWNFWTFRVRGNGNFDADERTEFFRISGGLSADRTTDALKLQFGVDGSHNESDFTIDDSTSVSSVRSNYGASGLAVWSLNDRWSIGGQARVAHSTFSNEDVSALLAPAIEFNIFPYAESSRRQFSFLYSIGLRHLRYIEETVFLKTEETLPTHSLDVSLSVRQPWGGTFGSLEFSQLLNDPGKNRFDAFAGMDLRLFRGLSLNFNVRASRVRDQINLPAGEATQEEILLRQRELATAFEYGFSMGFSYTFGSIFSNVVNPRFEDF
jgi:hypothetical protein